MSLQVEVRDLQRLRRTLAQVDKSLPAKVITPSMRAAADEVVLPRAKQEAPVGDPADYAGRRRPRPGRLARSVRILANQRRVAIAAGRTALPYANAVYWGWPGHNIAPNRFLERAAANAGPGRLSSVLDREVTRRLELEVSR